MSQLKTSVARAMGALARYLAPLGRALARYLAPLGRALARYLAPLGRALARYSAPLRRYLAPISKALAAYFARLRGGDVGSLPAVLGFVALVLVFSSLRPDTFTGPLNFANLIFQAAGVMVLAMGLIFVLLLGEIDLSAGYTGGVAATVFGIAATRNGWDFLPALLAALITGAVIGFLTGVLVAKLGIPSFVVTLSAFLAYQGVVLQWIGERGTIRYNDEIVLALNNKPLDVTVGWLLTGIGLLAYALVTWRANSRRRKAGLEAEAPLVWSVKTLGLSALVVAVIWYLSIERSVNPTLTSIRGVPIVLAVIAGLAVVLTFMLNHTAWGRHVYAVGGNAEAARRAGINVDLVKISCFMLCSTLSAFAGLLLASRTNSVGPTTGGSQTLLFAVGAAVIGGTSLFGGKGRIVDAIIGGLTVMVIGNGLGLLNQPAAIGFMITGLVLLLAASVDAISRRRAAATGRG
jgi:D-xylose transport system permease protein